MGAKLACFHAHGWISFLALYSSSVERFSGGFFIILTISDVIDTQGNRGRTGCLRDFGYFMCNKVEVGASTYCPNIEDLAWLRARGEAHTCVTWFHWTSIRLGCHNLSQTWHYSLTWVFECSFLKLPTSCQDATPVLWSDFHFRPTWDAGACSKISNELSHASIRSV